jgi:hypothetical protein
MIFISLGKMLGKTLTIQAIYKIIIIIVITKVLKKAKMKIIGKYQTKILICDFFFLIFIYFIC